MIGGFIIGGSAAKPVAIRAIGPSLLDLGIKGALLDPTLEVYNSSGVIIAQNDNWTSLPPESIPDGLAPTNSYESLVSTSLPPGNYTAVLRGTDGSAGVALVELYDLDAAKSSVRNISTRGLVGTGDDVLIGGFIVAGQSPVPLIIRAIGPSLAGFGAEGVLADPVLELDGQDRSLIYSNDNWRSDQEQQIINTNIPPADDREAAIIATLSPDRYTAIIRGAGDTTGVALVEVYNLEQP